MTELVFHKRNGWTRDDVEIFHKLAQRYLIVLVHLIQIGLDTIMPIKQTKLHINDPPWITQVWRTQLNSARKPLSPVTPNVIVTTVTWSTVSVKSSVAGTSHLISVNSRRPNQVSCGCSKKDSSYCASNGSESLFSQLHIEGYDSLPLQDIANRINDAFLEPMEPFFSVLRFLQHSKRTK